ncbi:MAG: ubiquinol-cytochrome c reductase iron-sulfur subunit [Ardenticatenaceae bacterium]|nr:ubiquinol-cytochrome c reductase iron-sulfur subunit [Anaerolineales bacterium]MCB8921429.1 ubiquinol-cytochrome c reductase iron-sulfur subunit [Ardenticatenaceae bacterium]MCB8991546.1 ubiquinol-cytochrome c reductase iron-sulfur subunit [Ardenticatenaceae bacterium]MCB9005092.1 ubiquinol-cytochrome c reductase iron-sulfur subunit [Ardenticatenaceae bacterium]
MANAAASVSAGSGGITRREFLYYIWGASIALVAAQSAGLLVWFLIPKFREGEFGGKFPVSLDSLPPDPNSEPVNFADGRFWLVNLDTTQSNALMYQAEDESQPIKGVAAIYKVCTHLGCIYSWTPANDRFECPCHGSKYRLDGRRIESPAPRSLDRFKLEALAEDGTVLAESSLVNDVYQPLELPDGTFSLSVDTGDRKKGNSLPLLCSFTGSCP